MYLARYWKKEGEFIRCNLCPRRCLIAEGKVGFCGVRKNIGGKLYSLVYARPSSIGIDPIEKKPFYHFYPGTKTLSFATIGCNFRCKFCVTPKTMIITNKGIFSIKELFSNASKKIEKDGGFIAFFDGDTITHKGEFSKIVKVYKHKYVGEIVKLKAMCMPELKCTQTHELVVYDTKDRGIKKIKAKDVTKDHLLVVPKIKLKNPTKEKLDLKEILSKIKIKYKKKTKLSKRVINKIVKLHKMGLTSKEIAKVINFHPTYVRKLISKLKKTKTFESLFLEDNIIVEKQGSIKFKTEKRPYIPRYIDLNEDIAYALGMYCADGHVTKNKGRVISHTLVYSFGHKELKKLKRVKEIIETTFKIKMRIVKRRTTYTLECGKASVALFFKLLAGGKSESKKVPNVILNSNDKKILKAFIRGVLDGDGYVAKENVEFVTISKKLAYGIVFLLLKLGILSAFYHFKQTTNKIENRKIKRKMDYIRIKIFGKRQIAKLFGNRSKILREQPKYRQTKDFYLLPIVKVEKEKYNGYVYNLEVKSETHTYLANFISVGNCCNWEISQARIVEMFPREVLPKEIVQIAEKNKVQGIAYTYVEPTIFFEYAYDTAKIAKPKGFYNVFVTNGYAMEEPLKDIKPYLDAAVIDFKGNNEKFYREFTSAELEEVKKGVLKYKKIGVHIEITNLIIPGLNDSLDELRDFAKWIKEKVGKNTPYHILRYFPTPNMRKPGPTPLETLKKAYDISKEEGLNYVYIGNIEEQKYNNTYCPNCGELLIERAFMQTIKINLKDGKCPKCGTKIPIVM